MEGFAQEWQTPPHGDILHMDLLTEMHDGTFEPQTRARSNTWPCPRPENFIDPPDDVDSTKASKQQLAGGDSQPAVQNLNAAKKNSSRRNAWGNLSYADLITHAIGSATDKRLTLSQIYEWMVHNVPYFKDKGDSNSSAGWKNSIRHNLSLHNRFMRVQNEGTGKSSWWMLNPDAKPGKSVRRRAASMETSRYEKRRGRAKKRVEALRQAGVTALNDNTPSPSSSVSEGLDQFPESPLHSGYPISPDFRQRASSNASSYGRLSPRPALVDLELDWSFSTDYQNSNITPAQSITLDQLAGSIAEELKLQQGFSAASGLTSHSTQAPPPPYPTNQHNQQTSYSLNGPLPQGFNNLSTQQQCMLHRSLTCNCLHNTTRDGLSPNSVTTMSPAYPNSEPSSDSLNTYTAVIENSVCSTTDSNAVIMVQQHQQQQRQNQQQQQQQQQLQQQHQQQQQQRQQQQQQQQQQNQDNNCASTLIGQCMEALNNEQSPIVEFNIDNFQGGLECNIEELMQHEINIDGLLDINIPLTAVNNNATTINTANELMDCMNITTVEMMNTQQQISQLQQHIQQQQHQQLQQQQQQQHQQQHQHQQCQQLPSLLNTSNNIATANTVVLPNQGQTTNNATARLPQYTTQASLVTPPSWVH